VEEEVFVSSLRLIHTADVHLDSTFAQARLASDLGQALRLATREVLKRVLALVRERQADALLIAGDLYDHEYVTPDTGAFVRDALAALGDVPVLITPGNHDPCLPDSLYARLDWPPNVHLFRRQEWETITLEELGLVVHGFAHEDFGVRERMFGGGGLWGVGVGLSGVDGGIRPTTQNPQPTTLHPPAADGLTHVVLAHGSDLSRLPFNQEDYAPFEPAELAAVSGVSYWALGHYHNHARVEAGEGVVACYPGCVQGRNFGEIGTRYALEVSIEDGTASVTPHAVGLHPFETAEVDVTGVPHSDALAAHLRKRFDPAAWSAAVTRLTLVGEVAPTLEISAVHLREQLADVFYDLTLVDRTQPVLLAEVLASEQTARVEFVRRLMTRLKVASDGPERETVQLALRLGLAAYEGRQMPLE
jgi:exonuclease SbcD